MTRVYRSTKRDERKLATQDKVLAAATTVFQRDGYEAATLRVIAAEAGVSTGAIFASWPGKAELYCDVYGHDPITPEVGEELHAALSALVLALSDEAGALAGPQHEPLRRRVFAALRAASPALTHMAQAA